LAWLIFCYTQIIPLINIKNMRLKFFSGIMIPLFIVVLFFGFIALGPAIVTAEEDLENNMTAGEAADLLDQYYGAPSPVAEEVFLNPVDIPDNEFYQAEIVEVVVETTEEIYEGYTENTQELRAKILNGPEKGRVIETVYGGIDSLDQYQKVKSGDRVILVKTYKVDGTFQYYVSDHYRLTPLIVIFLIFVGLVVFFGRFKGLGSLLGLGFSIVILVKYIVPQIIQGQDPLIVTLSGTLMIACVSLFLARGFNKRTAVSLLSTVVTLVIAVVVSELLVKFAYLFGQGSEEAFFLHVDNLSHINLRGLLLAGIVIGTLGLLDDITTAQTAVVGELRQANSGLSKKSCTGAVWWSAGSTLLLW